jgi:sortase A
MLSRNWSRRVAAVALLLISIGLAAKASYIPAKALLAKGLIENAWDRTLEDGERHTPWSWADHWPVARLTVPSQGIDKLILNGAQGNSLAFAPGAMTEFAQPGTVGTAIVGGHRDTDFSFLKDLVLGDELRLQTATGEWQNYEVMAFDVVDGRNAHIETTSQGQSLLLVTCYPFDALVPGGPLRYVVSTRRVF